MSDQIIFLVPLVAFTLVGFRSVVIDLREHRLPNGLTVQLAAVSLFAQICTAIVSQDWSRWLPTFKTVLCISAGYLLLYALSKNSLGFGDVKFAIPCALTVGFYAPNQWLAFLWISFGCAALTAILLWGIGRADRSSAIAFGPFMYLGVILVASTALLGG